MKSGIDILIEFFFLLDARQRFPTRCANCSFSGNEKTRCQAILRNNTTFVIKLRAGDVWEAFIYQHLLVKILLSFGWLHFLSFPYPICDMTLKVMLASFAEQTTSVSDLGGYRPCMWVAFSFQLENTIMQSAIRNKYFWLRSYYKSIDISCIWQEWIVWDCSLYYR